MLGKAARNIRRTIIPDMMTSPYLARRAFFTIEPVLLKPSQDPGHGGYAAAAPRVMKTVLLLARELQF